MSHASCPRSSSAASHRGGTSAGSSQQQATVLPGFVITAITLLRRKPVAFVLAPVLIVFGILMTVAVAGVIGALIFKGLANDYVVAAVLAGMAAGLAVLLVRYLRV